MKEEHAIEGHGVFSASSFSAGETILLEKPLVLSQDFGNRLEVLVCKNCGALLGGEQLRTMYAEGLVTLPDVLASLQSEEGEQIGLVPCSHWCGELYCSESCREERSLCGHGLLCVGKVGEEEAESHPLFRFKQRCAEEGRDLLLAAGEILAFLVSAHAGQGSLVVEGAESDSQSVLHHFLLDLKARKGQDLSSTVFDDLYTLFSHFEQPVWFEERCDSEEESESERLLLEDLAALLRDAFKRTLREQSGEEGAGSFVDEVVTGSMLGKLLGMFDCNIMEVWARVDTIQQEKDDEDEKEEDEEDCECEECDMAFEGSALLSFGCSLNHSCYPNSIVRWFHDEEHGGCLVARLVALRPIEEGEELTITYEDLWKQQEEEENEENEEENEEENPASFTFEELSLEDAKAWLLPMEERKAAILERRRFVCSCPLCLEEENC